MYQVNKEINNRVSLFIKRVFLELVTDITWLELPINYFVKSRLYNVCKCKCIREWRISITTTVKCKEITRDVTMTSHSTYKYLSNQNQCHKTTSLCTSNNYYITLKKNTTRCSPIPSRGNTRPSDKSSTGYSSLTSTTTRETPPVPKQVSGDTTAPDPARLLHRRRPQLLPTSRTRVYSLSRHELRCNECIVINISEHVPERSADWWLWRISTEMD